MNTHRILGGIIAVLFVGVGILFFQQSKLIAENRKLTLLVQKTAENTILETNKNIGNVKDELAQFKIKSAENTAALEKKASEIKPTIVEKIIERPAVSTPTVSSIVKTWQPVVARITCEFRYTNGILYGKQSGSGTLISFSNGARNLVTNKHVISDSQGYGPTSCLIKFPGDSASYGVTIDDITLSTKGSDMASIKTNMVPSTIGGSTTRNYCTDAPDSGDQIAILGYPAIGGTDLTVTEGIISGNEGAYYITSAKVEQGNSGGAAIDLKNNCYLGIPTFVQAGQIESLARILKWQSF
ncbi:MAG: hypothetical protein RL641_10 [Candidatus Parcubacteria bacterium]